MSASIESAREHYARRVVADIAGIADEPLRRALLGAFARVPRERFLGPPPWRVYSPFGQTLAIEHDARALYQDTLVVLSAERQINNGQPSLHAACLATLRPQPGETALHVGAGGGYYTALLAELVGPTGGVHAYEIEPDLAARAAQALADRPQVRLHAGSAFDAPLPPADMVYASAGASHPPAPWLDALRPGGRLVFPLTRDDGGGAMLAIERPAHGAPDRFDARFIARVQFIGCVGARDALQAERLALAFERGGAERVRRLRRGSPPDASRVWCAGADWWLESAD